MTTTVTTQAELDAALKAGEDEIVIDSPKGVWIYLKSSGSATVRASGSATVTAYGSATVTASGSATVTAYGSATVHAYGSATVTASGSATVRASGSATVTASGSATVHAYGSATVHAYGSATVHAYGSATVTASGSATVTAARYVAVHLHSKHVTLDGGVVIDVTDLDLTGTPNWLDYFGIDQEGGFATVYKAVDANLNAGQSHRLTAYPIGGTVAAPDWKASQTCGNGLHFGATPHHALRYYNGTGPARFLECLVAVAELVALRDKCKAPACYVIREVDIAGRPVEAKAGKR